MPRLKNILGGVAAVAVAVVALSLIFRGCDSFFSAQKAAIQTYFRAVGSGDSKTACGLLADSAKAKLKTQQETTTCEDAVRNLAASLTQAQRDELTKGDISVTESVWADSRTEITLDGGDPLQLEVVVLYEQDGHVMITDWGWNARQVS